MMNDEEIFYSIALTRMTGFNLPVALQLYHTWGAARRFMSTEIISVM